MMWHRVPRAEFYRHVTGSRDAAQCNGHTTNRRETADSVTYEINGVPNAQRTVAGTFPKFYVIK